MLPRTALALAVAGVSTGARAELITVVYEFPSPASVALDFFFFGGDHGPVEGEIVSTRAYINDYTAPAGGDIADFASRFTVPVLDNGMNSEFFLISGADLGWSGPGPIDYFIETDAHNGEIRPGRFGWELEGGGTFGPGSRIEFDVEVIPTPSVMALLGMGGLVAVRRRR